MCSLGTVLWLMLVPACHLCSLNGVTDEIDPCATYHIFALPSFAGQNVSISASSLLSQYFSFSELNYDLNVSALNQKSMQFLDNKESIIFYHQVGAPGIGLRFIKIFCPPPPTNVTKFSVPPFKKKKISCPPPPTSPSFYSSNQCST